VKVEFVFPESEAFPAGLSKIIVGLQGVGDSTTSMPRASATLSDHQTVLILLITSCILVDLGSD
jgi:hypothetical protein